MNKRICSRRIRCVCDTRLYSCESRKARCHGDIGLFSCPCRKTDPTQKDGLVAETV